MKIRTIFLTIIIASVLAACSGGYSTSQNQTGQGATAETNSPSSNENNPTEAAAASQTSEPMANVMNFDVQISGFAFVENDLTIHVGDTVTWVNHDSASHSVVADDGSFKSGTLSNNDSFSFTFPSAGTYTYHCGFHSYMTGTIIVQP